MDITPRQWRWAEQIVEKIESTENLDYIVDHAIKLERQLHRHNPCYQILPEDPPKFLAIANTYFETITSRVQGILQYTPRSKPRLAHWTGKQDSHYDVQNQIIHLKATLHEQLFNSLAHEYSHHIQVESNSDLYNPSLWERGLALLTSRDWFYPRRILMEGHAISTEQFVSWEHTKQHKNITFVHQPVERDIAYARAVHKWISKATSPASIETTKRYKPQSYFEMMELKCLEQEGQPTPHALGRVLFILYEWKNPGTDHLARFITGDFTGNDLIAGI